MLVARVLNKFLQPQFGPRKMVFGFAETAMQPWLRLHLTVISCNIKDCTATYTTTAI